MEYKITLEAILQLAEQAEPGLFNVPMSEYNFYTIVNSDQSEYVVGGQVLQAGSDFTASAGELATSYFEDSAYPIYDVIGIQSGESIVEVPITDSMSSATLAIAAPSTATVTQGQATAITGISISESGSTAGEMFEVALSDTYGDLSATGSGVSGAGTTSLTITDTLSQVNADLKTLTDTDGTTPSDTITIQAGDGLGNTANPQTIAVTVKGLWPTYPLGITLESGGAWSAPDANGDSTYTGTVNIDIYGGRDVLQVVGATVARDQNEFVFTAGATAHLLVDGISAAIAQGAFDLVYAEALATTLNGGDDEYVLSGGTAINTAASGGTKMQFATPSYTTVNTGGTQYVYSAGEAFGTTVNDGGIEQVSAGGSAVSTTVNDSGYEFVHSGGTASDTTVSNGGDEIVYRGGSAVSATIRSGGYEVVSNGGSASGDTVSSGGYEVVYVGGSAVSATMSNGGYEIVFSGGTASDATVTGGGDIVYHSGSAVRTTISAGGYEFVSNGGTASSDTVSSGGYEIVYSGGSAIGATVDGGGHEVVSSGGFAYGITLNSGGDEDVNSDGTVSVTMVNSGGLLDLQAGSTVDGAIIFGTAGGTVEIDGGTVPTNVISGFAPGDTLDLPAVPYASQTGATVFETNNILQLSENGDAYDLNLDPAQSFSGGFELSADATGGTEITTVPNNGSPGSSAPVADYSTSVYPYNSVCYITIPGGTATGFIIGQNSILTAAHVVDDDISSGTLSKTGVLDASSLMVYPGDSTGSGGTAVSGLYSIYVDPAYVPGLISPQNSQNDFAVINVNADLLPTVQTSLDEFQLPTQNFSGGTVNITGYPGIPQGYAAGPQYNDIGAVAANPDYNTLDETTAVSYPGDSGGPLWVYDGSTATAVGIVSAEISGFGYDVQLTPSDDADINTWESDGLSPAPCYCPGTLIATDHGEVAVEGLRVGDLVWTVLGETVASIIWIGVRRVNCARHPKPKQVWPVRVAADAFGPGRPHTDLFLSPDHAIYVNEVLIPVKHLINGNTIRQVAVDQVTYYHIELPQHDVVLAQGLPAESYLNTGGRSTFANGGAQVRLFPDIPVRIWEAYGCAPLVVTGPELTAARGLVSSFAETRYAA